MPAGGTRPETFDEIDASGGGVGRVGRVAHSDEAMQRAGDAIAGDGDVRPVDPVDAEGLDDRLAEIGAVRGVFVLYTTTAGTRTPSRPATACRPCCRRG